MINPEAINSAKRHAKLMFPFESCGIIVDGGYVPCTNTHHAPDKSFTISANEYIAIERQGKIDAVIHSHPEHNYPSERDMAMQAASNVPWGIVYVPDGVPKDFFLFGDQLPMEPLLGRNFRWGVADCYSLVRDWYFLEGVKLPVTPRRFGCFDAGVDLFSEFEEHGFIEIDRAEARGDCMIFKMDSQVPNHCAVLVSTDRIIHQPLFGVSRTGPAGLWAKKAVKHLRHKEFM